MCTRQTSLQSTIFVSSSFLFIVKDDAARDLIFSDPYITKHSKVHCICKYLSLSLQQWSLINNRYNLYEYQIFVSVCVSRIGSPLLISLSSLPSFCHNYFFCLCLCHCWCLLFYFLIVIVILFVFVSQVAVMRRITGSPDRFIGFTFNFFHKSSGAELDVTLGRKQLEISDKIKRNQTQACRR